MSRFRVLTNQICPWAGRVWCTEGAVISANPFVPLLGLLGHRRGECKAYKGESQLQSAPGYKYAIKPLKVQFQSKPIVAKFIPFWSRGMIFNSYYINSTYFISFTVLNFRISEFRVILGLAQFMNKWAVLSPSKVVPARHLTNLIKLFQYMGGLRICCMHLFIALNASIGDEGISVEPCSEFSFKVYNFILSLIYSPLHSFFLHLMSELKTYWLWVYWVLGRNALIILQSLSVQSCNVNTVDCKHIRKD